MALSTILVTLDNGQHTFLQHNTQCVALVTVVLTWDPEKVGHYNCASALNGVNRLNWASKFSEIRYLMWCWPWHQLSNDGLDKKTWAYHPYPEYNTIALRPAAEWKARNSHNANADEQTIGCSHHEISIDHVDLANLLIALEWCLKIQFPLHDTIQLFIIMETESATWPCFAVI